jgi:hypothetical protein
VVAQTTRATICGNTIAFAHSHSVWHITVLIRIPVHVCADFYFCVMARVPFIALGCRYTIIDLTPAFFIFATGSPFEKQFLTQYEYDGAFVDTKFLDKIEQ